MINEFKAELYHPGEKSWKEGEFDVTRSAMWSAPGCHNGCGVLFYSKDGKLDHVEGDPDSWDMGRLCLRCLGQSEKVYHKDRLMYPMLRDRADRGKDAWKRITWDEALDWIEDAYNDVCETIRTYPGGIGPEGITVHTGTGRNAMWQEAFICRGAFGSPNFTSSFLSGECCYQPRSYSAMFKYGDINIADCAQTHVERYDLDEYVVPEVILLWGNQPLESNGDITGHMLIDLMRMGSKLITIDPGLTWLNAKADIHLKVRPGTDTALALAMLHVIINEELYDKDFVEKWVYGFEDYKEHVQEWTPEKAEEICWIPADDIRAAARMYANAKPALLQWGLALDQQISGFEACMAIEDLQAITGNLDVPGGQIITRMAYNCAKKYGCGLEFIDDDMKERRIGLYESPIVAAGYAPLLTSDRVLEQIESGEPYPILMSLFEATNPLACTAQDASRVYEAMMGVKYIIVHDVVMTPTAMALADLVLPAQYSVEREGYHSWYNPLAAITPGADVYGEGKSDDELCLWLGKRFNPDFFNQFETARDFITWIIQDEGHGWHGTWEELSEVCTDYWPFNEEYRKYEKGLLRQDGQPGFATATGQFELASPIAPLLGMNPMPEHVEPYEGPLRTPELMEEYPYILTTGHRSWGFFHSEQREVSYMRQFEQNPVCTISRDVAENEGISDGDWIWIENDRGKFKQIAKIVDGQMPGLVRAKHGWWFPEQEGAAPNLYGVFDCNSNDCTTMGVIGKSGYGAPAKSTICKVYKLTDENNVSCGEIVTQGGGFGGNHKTKFQA